MIFLVGKFWLLVVVVTFALVAVLKASTPLASAGEVSVRVSVRGQSLALRLSCQEWPRGGFAADAADPPVMLTSQAHPAQQQFKVSLLVTVRMPS